MPNPTDMPAHTADTYQGLALLAQEANFLMKRFLSHDYTEDAAVQLTEITLDRHDTKEN
uniref:Uncharacterized protein n=1 Tax=Actinobacteria phage HS02 TaxID=3056388 RepID=A0AA50A6M5_9VIRU|nr:MAG: hypothetical protein [Actinobacteria phage HS02]